MRPLLVLAAGLFAAKNEGTTEDGGRRLLGAPVDALRDVLGAALEDRVTKASIASLLARFWSESEAKSR